MREIIKQGKIDVKFRKSTLLMPNHLFSLYVAKIYSRRKDGASCITTAWYYVYNIYI